MEKNTKNTSKITSIINKIRTFFSSAGKRITGQIERRPLVSFFGLLVVILILIVVGNTLRKPKPTEEEVQKPSKSVEVFSIGKAPRITFTGKVEKSGAIKLVAQAPGIVQAINLVEGTKVFRGQSLISLSSNYQGGNIASVSRQIAEKNAKLAEETYPDQLALIQRQKEIAVQTDKNADELRAITATSIQSTRDLIALNQEIINSLDQQIEYLQSQPSTPETTAAIMGAKQGKAGATSGLASLKTALASSEYQTESGNPPEKLSDLGKDIALGQLGIQEKSLNLSKEIAGLNLKIAKISESLMYPASPCTGTVERIFVNIGDAVNPGQQVASIVCTKNVAQVIVPVSGDIARQISRVENSILTINGKAIEMTPRYVSTEPTDGNLFSVLFTLQEDIGENLGDNSSIPVQIPVGNAQSTASVPYIPIDAVFQTQASSTIYIASESAQGKWVAEGREIILGQVFGSYVEVQKGLSASDQVILNRNVIAGDEVTF